jgi:hypothetical protein
MYELQCLNTSEKQAQCKKNTRFEHPITDKSSMLRVTLLRNATGKQENGEIMSGQ